MSLVKTFARFIEFFRRHVLELPEDYWLFHLEGNLKLTLVSVISTIGDNIFMCTKLFEIFRLRVPDAPEKFSYVHSVFALG